MSMLHIMHMEYFLETVVIRTAILILIRGFCQDEDMGSEAEIQPASLGADGEKLCLQSYEHTSG
jgi:hypothetical protein